MKRHFHQILIDRFKESFPQYKKEVFERERQSENVIIWIVGLSTAVITIIFSQFANIKVVPILSLKYAVFFFLLTVISGVLYRVSYYELEQLEGDIAFEFENYCAASCTEFNIPKEIANDDTIEDIARYLKEYTGVDNDSWISKELNRDYWVNLYNNWRTHWEKTEKEGLINLGRAFAPLIGINKEDGDKLFLETKDNNKTYQKAKNYRIYCCVFHFSTLSLFLIAISILGFGFIAYK